MHRGEIRLYRPVLQRPGQPLLRLILSGEAVNRHPSTPFVLAAHIVDEDPETLLHVALPPHGWVAVMTVQPTLRSRLDELVGHATPEQMTAVDAAIAAVFEIE